MSDAIKRSRLHKWGQKKEETDYFIPRFDVGKALAFLHTGTHNSGPMNRNRNIAEPLDKHY